MSCQKNLSKALMALHRLAKQLAISFSTWLSNVTGTYTAAPASRSPVARIAWWASLKRKCVFSKATASSKSYLARQHRTRKSGDRGQRGLGSELKTEELNEPPLNERIILAVAGLDKSNAEHFTSAGKPRVAAVSTALGEIISSEQLNAALASQGEDA